MPDLAFADDRLPERFWEKVYPEPNTGCWLWGGSTSSNGYGKLELSGSTRSAHSLTAALAHGQRPAGLEIDHLCRVRACCNPAHLEYVTRRENARRGDSFHRNSPTCKRGHEWTEQNTHTARQTEKQGGGTLRQCRACKRIREATYRKARA